MSWSTIYIVGALLSFFIFCWTEARTSPEKENLPAIIVSALLWPLAWLFGFGVSLGRRK